MGGSLFEYFPRPHISKMHLFVSPIPFCALAFVALTLAAPPIHLPTTSSLTSNLTLPDPASRCNTFDTWIGAGITKEDCQAALNELWWADVDWRKGQKYEFLRQGVSRHSDHPWVTTPRKHWYGTCVVEIVMLDTFSSHSLPGSRSILPTLKSDTATFNQIWDVANEVFKTCVKRRNPYAGWGWAGELI